MIKQLGILGYPLGHTISPVFQQAALDYYSLAVRYTAWPTTQDSLPDRLKTLRSNEYLGANVTIPYKEQVVPMLDKVEGYAAKVGAVNTIVKDGEILVGHNTDVSGFVRSLKKEGFVARDKSALIMGAGGAARAAAFGLVGEGMSDITIANRTKERANDLAREINHLDIINKVCSVAWSSLFTAAKGVDLIVNATSIGMKYTVDSELTPLSRNAISPTTLVYDMVYIPAETPLICEARAAGANVLGGLPMLIYQGAVSLELWTGREAPIEVMFGAARKALEP